MSIAEAAKNIDYRPRRNGWAPGGYICQCTLCCKDFIGDKRAIHCAPCAYDKMDTEDTAV
jgi:hypothetical protein